MTVWTCPVLSERHLTRSDRTRGRTDDRRGLLGRTDVGKRRVGVYGLVPRRDPGSSIEETAFLLGLTTCRGRLTGDGCTWSGECLMGVMSEADDETTMFEWVLVGEGG